MPTATYFEPQAPAYTDFPNKLEVEYKGFNISKRPEMNLYSIVIPDGKTLHRSLYGDFTKIELLKSQIDTFLKEYGTIFAAFTDIEVKRGRGRPKKVRHPLELIASTSDNVEDS